MISGHIPFFFFFWGPALVALGLIWGIWRMRRLGVRPGLGSDIDGYSARDVREILELYGVEGRAAWRWRILPADTAFAAFYGLVALGLALGLMERGHGALIAFACGGGWILASIMDIRENMAFARMADTFPAVDELTARRAASFTTLKFWLFLIGLVGVLAAFYLARPTADPLLRSLFSVQ
jgi:hypothetical protein